MIVRKQQADDYEAILHVYAEAFRRPHFRPPLDPGSVPPEVSLFEAGDRTLRSACLLSSGTKHAGTRARPIR